MFKNIDKKFEEIGFIKVSEDKYGARYERLLTEEMYLKCLGAKMTDIILWMD